MSATTMTWQTRVDDFVERSIEANEVIQVQGSAGRGKTRLLRDAAVQLLKQDFIPLFLSPPQRGDDTGGAALAATADALKQHNLFNGQAASLRDLHRSRNEKIGVVVEAMRKAKDSIVLLLDEPFRWIPDEYSGESSATGRQFTLQVCCDLATQSGCRVVYTGDNFALGNEKQQQYYLPKAWNDSDLSSALTEHAAWKEIKVALAKDFPGHATPLLCRVLTMLSIIASPGEAVDAIRRYIGLGEIVAHLERSCVNRPQLHKAWARFALVRTTIDQKLYDRLIGDVPSDLRFVITEFLLTQIDGGYELHPLLSRAIEPKSTLDSEYQKVQDQLARYYLDKRAYLADATEAFFHATETGDDGLMSQAEPFFVEQFHLWGRALSKQRRHREAAEIFRKASELDPADDYVRHYRAFNLDWIAEEQPTIENEYQEAIKLNPRHPWWHSRWINYLITVGKTVDARVAFANAAEALQEAVEAHPDYIYRSLHSWVMALLLRRGQLEFARQIFDCVPLDVRREHRGFVALGEKLAALEETRRVRGVFPLSIPASQHWRKAPHLDFPPQVDGRELRTWYPARVEIVSDQSITLIVGKLSEREALPSYGKIEIPRQKFEVATLDDSGDTLCVGRFLELAFYGDEGILKVQMHHTTAWEDADLPYLNPPDTLRYLRKQERLS